MAQWTWDDVRVAAAAIANARGGRRGAPQIRNILSVLPRKLRDDVMADALAVARARDEAPDGTADDY